MKRATHEWVRKAEGDFVTASRELRSRNSPNFDASCFHAQQCAEKYLKGRLQEAGIVFRKTHDLLALLHLVLPLEPTWLRFSPDFSKMSAHAVDVRYPGPFVTKSNARSAVKSCTEFRKAARMSLGLLVTVRKRSIRRKHR